MKTRNVITAIGVAVLATITISLNAGEALLSTRALDQQTRIVPGTADKASVGTETRNFAGSPRALDSQSNHVQGTQRSANLTARKCAVIGSPRQAENSTLSCCKVAKSSCTAALGCCAK